MTSTTLPDIDATRGISGTVNAAPGIRLIAFYLPQYHPIPENDAWWGAGFTEWTNVTKAKPLFPSHYQPRLPADLGYYDLRVPETREAQADLAADAGIESFCYYHYWFAGRRILERPLTEMLSSGKPDQPFCLCWANETWSGIWHGDPKKILIEQTYPGPDDDEAHFRSLLPAFRDVRYSKANGRHIFIVYRPSNNPDIKAFIEKWRSLALREGLPGFYMVAHLSGKDKSWDYRSAGFDSAVIQNILDGLSAGPEKILKRLWNDAGSLPSPTQRLGARAKALGGYGWYAWGRIRRLSGRGFKRVVRYEDASLFFLNDVNRDSNEFPCVAPNWDNTPRSGSRGRVLHGSTPELFRKSLQDAASLVSNRPQDERIVFIKSWNEWAEGNYLEPDQRFGHAYLDVVREIAFSKSS